MGRVATLCSFIVCSKQTNVETFFWYYVSAICKLYYISTIKCLHKNENEIFFQLLKIIYRNLWMYHLLLFKHQRPNQTSLSGHIFQALKFMFQYFAKCHHSFFYLFIWTQIECDFKPQTLLTNSYLNILFLN